MKYTVKIAESLTDQHDSNKSEGIRYKPSRGHIPRMIRDLNAICRRMFVFNKVVINASLSCSSHRASRLAYSKRIFVPRTGL